MTNPQNRANLITETDLAERLQVSKKLLQKMRYEGNGPRYVKIGRLVRYQIKDVEAYLNDATLSFTKEGITQDLKS